jgi:hypothetical protein
MQLLLRTIAKHFWMPASRVKYTCFSGVYEVQSEIIMNLWMLTENGDLRDPQWPLFCLDT